MENVHIGNNYDISSRDIDLYSISGDKTILLKALSNAYNSGLNLREYLVRSFGSNTTMLFDTVQELFRVADKWKKQECLCIMSDDKEYNMTLKEVSIEETKKCIDFYFKHRHESICNCCGVPLSCEHKKYCISIKSKLKTE